MALKNHQAAMIIGKARRNKKKSGSTFKKLLTAISTVCTKGNEYVNFIVKSKEGSRNDIPRYVNYSFFFLLLIKLHNPMLKVSQKLSTSSLKHV